MDDQLIDHVIGDLLERTLTVARRPLLPVLAQIVAATHPLVKGPIHRNVQVGRRGKLAHRSSRLGIRRRGDEQPGDDLSIGIFLPDDVRHGGSVVGRQPVDDGPVAFSARHAQHPLAKRRHENRYRLLRHQAESEALDVKGVVGLGDLLAAERRLEKTDHVAGLLERLLERDSVPTLHDDVGGRADAEHETPGCRRCQSGDRLGQQRRSARVRREDRCTEPHRWGPDGAKRERGEAIGAHGLGGPEVGVAQPFESFETVSLLVELLSVKGNGHAEALHEAHPDTSRPTVSHPLGKMNP